MTPARADRTSGGTDTKETENRPSEFANTGLAK
jgi:hypothetical protein